ncbi:MAG: mechanosensitive ion channel family protein [Reyranella sp.]|nr:mechanosensitive ion channel family protein [Reyranella sp.]
MFDGMMKVYGRLAIVIGVLGMLAILDRLFTGPLAFVFGMSETTLGQWVVAALSFAGTLMIARIVKREVIHGWLEQRSGKQVPPLIGSLTSGLVIFIGICAILALVFDRDITGLVATGGASLMILGIALRDIVLALFTGILLNVEKPFRVGDTVRINDRLTGKVDRVTWRTTVLLTGNNETVYVPNLSLSSAVILNMAQPDTRSKQTIELVIDYDTSVESAERILYAATLGAGGVAHMAPPTVFARKLTPDGVLYEVAFTISNYADGKKSEHAVIKGILQCMRDADITISFPKAESIGTASRVKIANRSLDVFHLVQQVRLFRGLSEDLCHRISGVLIERHVAAGAPIVQAGERRNALFIVGEGMAKRTSSDREGAKVIQERFIATEFFGRKALFSCQAHNATVLAETAVLIYEFDRRALARLIAETPELIETFAVALAHLSWRASHRGNPDEEPPPAVIVRLVNLYRGQIEANYGPRPPQEAAEQAAAS